MFAFVGDGLPINRNLWTPTFISLVGGLAHFVLAGLHVGIDVRRWWSGAPFSQVGMNSLIVYVGHLLLKGYFPFTWGWQSADDHGRRLAQAMIGTAVWVLIACFLHSRGWFIHF